MIVNTTVSYCCVSLGYLAHYCLRKLAELDERKHIDYCLCWGGKDTICYLKCIFKFNIYSSIYDGVFQAQAMSSKPDLLDQVFEAVQKGISIENSCDLLLAMDTLLSSTNVEEMVGLVKCKGENNLQLKKRSA